MAKTAKINDNNIAAESAVRKDLIGKEDIPTAPKSTKKSDVVNVKIVDFEDRPMHYMVMQLSPEGRGHVGVKGRFNDEADAKDLVKKLKKQFKDRVYEVVPRKS